jgi:hypothetical protein
LKTLKIAEECSDSPSIHSDLTFGEDGREINDTDDSPFESSFNQLLKESSLVLFIPDHKSFEKHDPLLEKSLYRGAISLWSPLITFTNHSYLTDSTWERITFIPKEYEIVPDREFIIYNNARKKFVFNHYSLRRSSLIQSAEPVQKTMKPLTIADSYISNVNSIDNFDPQNDWCMGDVVEDLDPRESRGTVFGNYSADTDRDSNLDKDFTFLGPPLFEDDTSLPLDYNSILRESFSFVATPNTTTHATPSTSQKLSNNKPASSEPFVSNLSPKIFLQYDHTRKLFEDFPIATGKESFALQHVLQRCALDTGNMNLLTQQTAIILSIWIGSISENGNYLSLEEMIRKELLQFTGNPNDYPCNWIMSFLLDCFTQYPILKYFPAQLVHDYTVAKELVEKYCYNIY